MAHPTNYFVYSNRLLHCCYVNHECQHETKGDMDCGNLVSHEYIVKRRS